MIGTVLVVVAMRAEAQPIVARVGLEPVDGVPAGFPIAGHPRSVGGLPVAVTTNGGDPRPGVANNAPQPRGHNT
ncbi:MAG: hypothetical protein AAGA99_27935, partial [Actinomycetota bacterium]